jgi:membrane dipeptidase
MQYRTTRVAPKEPQAKRLPYDGYRSFQYLRPGVDYRDFKLAAEIDRVPSKRVEVSAADEQRVQRLLSENVVISLHDHVTVAPVDIAEMSAYRSGGREWTAYEGLSVSGLDAVFDALMGGTATITSRAGWKWDDVVHDLGMRLCDIAHQDLLVVAATRAAILGAKRAGQVAFIPCIESAAPIENELDRLDILYGLGIRSIGIAYSEAKAVERMERLGIAIDLSHAGDRTSLETIQASHNPVFITHAGARALWPTKRMKPDDVLTALAERGGVIGISAAANTTLTTRRPRHTLESVMEHFEYVATLIGIDHVAFGPDTFFGDHVGMHRLFSKHFSVAASRGPAFEEIEYVDGIENPAEAFPNVVRWLVKHGYSDADIGKVIGANVMRALEAVWVR